MSAVSVPALKFPPILTLVLFSINDFKVTFKPGTTAATAENILASFRAVLFTYIFAAFAIVLFPAISILKSPLAVAFITALLKPISVATLVSKFAIFDSFCIALITKLSALCSFAFNLALIFALFVALASAPVYKPKMLEVTEPI